MHLSETTFSFYEYELAQDRELLAALGEFLVDVSNEPGASRSLRIRAAQIHGAMWQRGWVSG